VPKHEWDEGLTAVEKATISLMAVELSLRQCALEAQQAGQSLRSLGLAFDLAFGQHRTLTSQEKLALRMIGEGWDADAAFKLSQTIPHDVCWLYPVPVPR